MEIANRKNTFDFLRFFAALLVFYGHCYWLTGNVELEPLLAFSGYKDLPDLGVDIFFVISGFLITMSYQRSKTYKAFVLNRAVRIFPGLIVAVLFSALVVGPLTSVFSASDYFADYEFWRYLLNMALITSYSLPGVFETTPFADVVNGSLWTLPQEVAMYCMLFSAGALGLLKPRVTTIILLLLAVGLFVAVQLPELPHTVRSFFRLGFLFFSGAFYFLVQQHVRFKSSVVFFFLFLLVVTGRTETWLPIYYVALPYIVLWVSQLDIPALTSFGKHGDISYGLYIYGFVVQQTVVHIVGEATPNGLFFASVSYTLILAVLSWRFIEKPSLRLKYLWSEKINAKNQQLGRP